MIFCIDMSWESCTKFNLEQLSLSLSRANIASFANIQGTQVSFATAEPAIFAPDMLWESWSKSNLEQLSHSTNNAPSVKFSSWEMEWVHGLMISPYYDPEPKFEERSKVLAELWRPALMIQQKHYVTDGHQQTVRQTDRGTSKNRIEFFKSILNFINHNLIGPEMR